MRPKGFYTHRMVISDYESLVNLAKLLILFIKQCVLSCNVSHEFQAPCSREVKVLTLLKVDLLKPKNGLKALKS